MARIFIICLIGLSLLLCVAQAMSDSEMWAELQKWKSSISADAPYNMVKLITESPKYKELEAQFGTP